MRLSPRATGTGFLSSTVLLLALLAPLRAQGRKPEPKPQTVPVQVSLRATWTDSRECTAQGSSVCKSCRDEGYLTADFQVEVEAVPGTGGIWRNSRAGRSQVKYRNRSYCPVDGEGDRTEGQGDAPIIPWAVFSKGGANLLQQAAMSMMIDRPPGALNYGRHLLLKHHEANRGEMEADAKHIRAGRSDPDGGVDRELGLIAPFRKTGHEAKSDPQGGVNVHLLVNLTRNQPAGSVSWEERGLNVTWGLCAVHLKGLTGGRNEGHQEDTEADSNRVVRYTVTWNFAPPADDEMIFDVASDYERWIPAPRPEDLPGIGVSPSEEAWKPLEVKVKIRSKSGGPTQRAGKIRFTLEEVSRNSGYCINFPLGWKTKADLRFAKEQPPGIELKGAQASGSGTIAEAAETKEKVTEATVKLESLDPGAYGKLKATCAELKLTALHEATNSYALKIPRDEDGNHIADAWESKKGIPHRGKDWDDEESPGQQQRGDGLTLYDEYRGAVVVEGGRKVWRRLDPTRKEMFILDPDQGFPLSAWERATQIKAYRLDDGLVDPSGNPGPGESPRVNHQSADGADHAVFALKIVVRRDDPQDSPHPAFAEMAYGMPWNIRNALQVNLVPARFVARIEEDYAWLNKAVLEPDSSAGRDLLHPPASVRPSFPQDARQAWSRLADPGARRAIAMKLQNAVFLHETGHVLGTADHDLVPPSGQEDAARSCFMFIQGDWGRRQTLVYTALGQGDPDFAYPYRSFCKALGPAGYDCFGVLKVKDW